MHDALSVFGQTGSQPRSTPFSRGPCHLALIWEIRQVVREHAATLNLTTWKTTMIAEHTVFWRDFFLETRKELPVGDTLDSKGQNLGIAAATVLIRTFFPETTEEDFSALFRFSSIPGFEPIPYYPDDLGDHAKIEFEKGGLKPTAFDIAAILFETTGIEIPRDTELNIRNRELARELKSHGFYYPSIRMSIDALAYKESPELKGRLTSALDQIANFVDKQQEQFSQDLVTNLEKWKSSAFDEIESKKTEILTDLESNGAKHIENAKEEFKASFVLETAMRLWKTKAAQHTRLFYIGAAVFVLAILLPVGLVIENWDRLTTEFAKLVPRDQPFAFGSLILVTIPALGYAWILRLFSRFTLQNMILADDASQRRVLANTFIRLVGEGKVEDKDRTIMLNALFRPIPGAKEQDIQPPNLADFVNGKN